MKLMKTDFLRKCQFPLMLAFGSLPLPVLLLANLAPQALGLCGLLPAAYALLACACLLIPGKRRVIAGVIGCAALVLLGAWALPVGESLPLLALPIGYGALLFYSLQFAAWSREREIAFNWYVAGVLAHVFAQILVGAAVRTGETLYAPAERLLTVSFLCFLLLMLCSLNRASMNGASMGRQRIPARVRSRNRAMTLVFFALVLFVAAIPEVIAFIEACWNKLFEAIAAVIDFILRLIPEEEVTQAAQSGGGMEAFLGEEIAEPGLFAQIMEKIAMATAIVIGAVLLVLALRIVIRNLRKLMRALLERLSSFASFASEDYEDEITDTREGGSIERGAILSRLRRRMAFRDEMRMQPGERIRYRYQRLLHKHPDWHGGTTARENLPQAAAKLYERARYSGHPVDSSEAERFAGEIKNI